MIEAIVLFSISMCLCSLVTMWTCIGIYNLIKKNI